MTFSLHISRETENAILKGVSYKGTERNKVSRNKSDGKMCMTFLGGNYKTLLKDINENYNMLMGRKTAYYKDVNSPPNSSIN